MEASYFSCTGLKKKVGSCRQKRASPDFVVMRSSDFRLAEPYLQAMGMIPIDSFPNEITGIAFGEASHYNEFQVLGGAVTLQTDNIMLFSR